MSPVCGVCVERGKAGVDIAALLRVGAARGSAPNGRNREASEYRRGTGWRTGS